MSNNTKKTTPTVITSHQYQNQTNTTSPVIKLNA
jgi:hypothetical protein